MSTDRSGVCAWCGSSFHRPSRRGPAPLYCSAAHRQAAHRDRHRPDPRRQSGSLVSELSALRSRVEVLEERIAAPGKPTHRASAR